MTSRRYTVVLADRTTGVVRRFTISLRPTLALIATIFAIPVLVGLGARWSGRAAINSLQHENTVLSLENASYREATGHLAAQISSLQSAVDQIGARAAVDPAAHQAMEKLPSVVKSRAMGGAAAAAAVPLIGGAIGSTDTTFGALRELLGTIEARLNSVRTGVERRYELASSTPSIWPVAGWLSSAYGRRRDPFTGGSDFHPGLDISADHGLAVHATADGVITTAAPNGNYGNLVVIEHGFGIATRYGHLSRFGVKYGQRVHRGDVIGYVGSTGRSTSPHLHYEILVNGKLTNPLRLLARP